MYVSNNQVILLGNVPTSRTCDTYTAIMVRFQRTGGARVVPTTIVRVRERRRTGRD
jgi:hypothetical protein